MASQIPKYDPSKNLNGPTTGAPVAPSGPAWREPKSGGKK